MRDLLAARSTRFSPTRRRRAAAEAFYQNRTLAPLWLEKGVVSARASAAIARLKSSNTDGLDPNDYRIPALSAASPEALVEAELKLTATMLTFARHLQAGRFPQARIGQNIEMPQQPPDPADVLAKLADADIAKALDGFAPPHPGYRKLKAMLADMRGKAGGGTHQMAEGEPLRLTKVLTEDPRVPMLRERLGVAGDPSELRRQARGCRQEIPARQRYQRHQHARCPHRQGVNGPPRSQQIDVIIANMERWRWVPRDLGNVHVIVNIPEYTLRVMKDGGVHWSTRIVVGKPHLQTPLLTASMKYITVNPTWNVPPSIINNEYLPALAQDPTVLTRMGLKMEHNRDGTVHIYQPPGDGNALDGCGSTSQPLLVYQHDTPDRTCSRRARAYNHGLHAGAGPAEICGSSAQSRAPDRRLDRRADQEDVRQLRGGHPIPHPHPGASDLPDRQRR
jgi:murein L,D-transpeptidase YcbB/YkuD